MDNEKLENNSEKADNLEFKYQQNNLPFGICQILLENWDLIQTLIQEKFYNLLLQNKLLEAGNMLKLMKPEKRKEFMKSLEKDILQIVYSKELDAIEQTKIQEVSEYIEYEKLPEYDSDEIDRHFKLLPKSKTTIKKVYELEDFLRNEMKFNDYTLDALIKDADIESLGQNMNVDLITIYKENETWLYINNKRVFRVPLNSKTQLKVAYHLVDTLASTKSVDVSQSFVVDKNPIENSDLDQENYVLKKEKIDELYTWTDPREVETLSWIISSERTKKINENLIKYWIRSTLLEVKNWIASIEAIFGKNLSLSQNEAIQKTAYARKNSGDELLKNLIWARIKIIDKIQSPYKERIHNDWIKPWYDYEKWVIFNTWHLN